MRKTVVSQEEWDRSYQNFHFYVAQDCVTEKVDAILDSFVKRHPVSTCFEVGCFPGRYLAHFCKKYGFEANGVDAASGMSDGFCEWLEHERIATGTLKQGDAFETIDALCAEHTTFDFVYSLGLIEHFEDFMEVVKYHSKIVSKGGLVVIICPNFRGGLQYLMHWLVDRENLKHHVTASMNPHKWARLLRKEGFEISEVGYFGGFRFWAGEQKRGLFQQCLLHVFQGLAGKWEHGGKNHFFYSPYCILAAEKR